MKTLLSFVVLLSLSACGPDAELVASGKAHVCALQELQARAQANPGDPGLAGQMAQRADFLEAVINSAPEGSRSALQEAINAAAVEGCP